LLTTTIWGSRICSHSHIRNSALANMDHTACMPHRDTGTEDNHSYRGGNSRNSPSAAG
jgi:hypothetical protein